MKSFTGSDNLFRITLKLLFNWPLYNVYATGKSLSEALIFASTNPQYDNRLFIELLVQYKKITSSVHVVYTNCFCFDIQNNLCTQHVLPKFELGIIMY